MGTFTDDFLEEKTFFFIKTKKRKKFYKYFVLNFGSAPTLYWKETVAGLYEDHLWSEDCEEILTELEYKLRIL